MRFAYLVNKNKYIINDIEAIVYSSHNMQAIIDIMLDLMCYKKFNLKELGLVRKIAWKVQEMARIGNWISTWEREINEDDFTSGIFALALENKIINFDRLKKEDKIKIINKIKKAKIKEKFLKQWLENYRFIKKLSLKIKSINFKKFFSGLEKLIFFHLASKGYK